MVIAGLLDIHTLFSFNPENLFARNREPLPQIFAATAETHGEIMTVF
jgi:hypothetical protein